MRLIAHISDLHFGYNDPLLAKALSESLTRISPNVLVVSGDLVEHATDAEFQDARDFLDSLPWPQIIVPGNHDLPFYNLWRRFTEGLDKYRRFITENLQPAFIDDELAIVGADSAHLYPVKGGKITDSQLDDLVGLFASFPSALFRVLVTHHPFDLPEPSNPHLLIGHSRRAVTLLAPVVDILLAGHVHVSSTGSTSTRYKLEGQAIAFVQAGTAISDRNKGENNSFNVIRTGNSESHEKQITVDRYSWTKDERRFDCKDSKQYRLGKQGWAEFQFSTAASTPIRD
ncbi:MAG TPA: metallophosphoesterase [Bryobacteraceae bacterium]|jgi:3',5'-cyclic AMP phosphodiesterase CpdA|nr:metallophosphoesterase [Bryobacteraceae bacterium]